MADLDSARQPYRPLADTMPVDQPMPAEACTELGNDEVLPPSCRLLFIICISTGVPFLLVLVSLVMGLLAGCQP